jgi:hypothetical protein
LRPTQGAGSVMSTKAGIKAAIIAKIGSTNYDIWRIGLTHDWIQRKKEWKEEGQIVDYWSCWAADSLWDAQDLESHFINNGMKGGVGGNLSYSKTVYVYVF